MKKTSISLFLYILAYITTSSQHLHKVCIFIGPFLSIIQLIFLFGYFMLLAHLTTWTFWQKTKLHYFEYNLQCNRFTYFTSKSNSASSVILWKKYSCSYAKIKYIWKLISKIAVRCSLLINSYIYILGLLYGSTCDICTKDLNKKLIRHKPQIPVCRHKHIQWIRIKQLKLGTKMVQHSSTQWVTTLSSASCTVLYSQTNSIYKQAFKATIKRH